MLREARATSRCALRLRTGALAANVVRLDRAGQAARAAMATLVSEIWQAAALD